MAKNKATKKNDVGPFPDFIYVQNSYDTGGCTSMSDSWLIASESPTGVHCGARVAIYERVEIVRYEKTETYTRKPA